MSEFYFQQYASRDARGYRWRDGGAVQTDRLETFFGALRKSGIFPSDGRQLKRREGGVFLASGSAFGAVFAFRPAPPDFSGRSGGVVTNVLFFDVSTMRGKSLKKAWLHPCLNAGPGDAVPEKVVIFADTDFAGTEAERQFFALADRREPQAIIVPYAADRFAPIPIDPQPAPTMPPASDRVAGLPHASGTPSVNPQWDSWLENMVGRLRKSMFPLLIGFFAAAVLILGVQKCFSRIPEPDREEFQSESQPHPLKIPCSFLVDITRNEIQIRGENGLMETLPRMDPKQRWTVTLTITVNAKKGELRWRENGGSRPWPRETGGQYEQR